MSRFTTPCPSQRHLLAMKGSVQQPSGALAIEQINEAERVRFVKWNFFKAAPPLHTQLSALSSPIYLTISIFCHLFILQLTSKFVLISCTVCPVTSLFINTFLKKFYTPRGPYPGPFFLFLGKVCTSATYRNRYIDILYNIYIQKQISEMDRRG